MTGGQQATIIDGVVGLIVRACSMAIEEFVSVFLQRDSELADLKIERKVPCYSLIFQFFCLFST